MVSVCGSLHIELDMRAIWKKLHLLAIVAFVIGCLLSWQGIPNATTGMAFFGIPLVLVICVYLAPLGAVAALAVMNPLAGWELLLAACQSIRDKFSASKKRRSKK